MDLLINTTPAITGLNIIPGDLEISQPKADINLNIKQSSLNVDFEQVKVHIDQYQCFAELGFKNPIDLTKKYANLAKQKIIEETTRTVNEGDLMAEMHDVRKAIATIAKQNYFDSNKVDLTINALPKSRPEISFTGGDVDIEFDKGEIESNAKWNQPIINYAPGRVEVYLKQKNKVDIEYVGEKLDTMV